MSSNAMKYLLPYVLLLSTLVLPPVGVAAEQDEDTRRAEYHYQPSADPSADIQQALDQAANQGKLAMIVFGAEWCHDSVGFGSKLSEPEVQEVVQSAYVSVFVDVAYLEDMRALIQPLGYPINFGTPTVLVIDPRTRQLLNYDSVSVWQNAFSVPAEEYQERFGAIAEQYQHRPTPSSSAFKPSPALSHFTDTNVERLVAGYAALSPLMAAYDTDTLESKEEFEALWGEVLRFRSQLQKDILTLREQEQKLREAADSSTMPDYPVQSWE